MAVVMVLAILTGCDEATIQSPGGARILTGLEMDQVTAGSALAFSSAAAHGVGSLAQTAVLGIASAASGNTPIAGVPLINYANSQTAASANGGGLAQANLSSEVAVDGGGSRSSVTAVAASTGTGQAQVAAQFYGISTNRTDFIFGSATAAACCGSAAADVVVVNSTPGGSFSRELRGAFTSNAPPQLQSRIDIAAVSSAMPLVDPALVPVSPGTKF